MAQTFFSQCVAVLCSEAPDLAALRHLLERQGYAIKADEDISNWPEMQSAGLMLSTNFEDGATCWVDICDFPWPDDMGATSDPTLVTAAYAMGAFGPFVYPGAFERALQAPGYESAAPGAAEHRAFVRFRISGLIMASEESKEIRIASAEKANPAWPISYLLRVAVSLMEMPVALAYFNPNSELLLTMQGLAGIMNFAFEQKTFPVEAICRVRGCRIDEDWSLVDCIGMKQVGLRDHEFAWADAEVSRQEQIEFLLNLLHYQIDNAVEISSGHTTDGPQNKLWRAEERENSCMNPPRQVQHWTMDGSPPEPFALIQNPVSASVEEEDEVSAEMIEVQAKIEGWLARRDAMRGRAVAWLRSPGFRSSYYDDAHFPLAFKVALEQGMSKKEARETWQNVQCLGQQTPALWSQYQQLATHGEVWLAVPLMVNPMFKEEVDTLHPCAVVVATDQTAQAIMLAGLFAHCAYGIYAGEEDAVERPETARMLANDEFRLFYREMFPAEETLGTRLLYLSVMLRKSMMPPSDVPFIPLLAIPGPKGAVVQIPWHVATGTPPLPGSVKTGRFAEMADIDRRADKVIAGQKVKKRGCRGMISLVATAIFIAGIVGSIALQFVEKSGGRETASKPRPPARKTVSNVSRWVQMPSLISRVSVVNAAEYEPLMGEDAAGSGFVFKTAPGVILAATSRHQFSNPDQPPSKLFDLEDLEVSLNTEQLVRQPDSQIQLVTEVSKTATCLEYRSSDTLKKGDMLRLILGKGKWIEGRLLTDADVPLSASSALLRLQVQTDENVAGTSGSPIVHAETGRVVGVMLGADNAQSPKFLEFETFSVTLD